MTRRDTLHTISVRELDASIAAAGIVMLSNGSELLTRSGAEELTSHTHQVLLFGSDDLVPRN